MTRWIAPMLLALLLTACGGDKAKKAEGAGTAQGEVLPGSVSDAMIPLDSVKSQAPLAPKVEGEGKKDTKSPAKAAADAVPEPAAEPESAQVEKAAAAEE
jgi:hypothetical protein